MMAIMTDGNKEELPKEFVEGGRTGRRNALPDILNNDANVTTADLPDRLQQLATSGVQSASSPSSFSSDNSENILMTLIDDPDQGINIDKDTSVMSSDTSESVCEGALEDFLHCGCCQRRNAIPKITPPTYLPQIEVSTSVSESSWKHCCSLERLNQFLNSNCSKRRCAVRCMSPSDRPCTSTDVSQSTDIRVLKPQLTCIGSEVARNVMQVIQLDEKKLMELKTDPNSPQPGPSSEANPPDEGKTDKKEGS